MNDEQFDKELSGLYQQRKSQIVAPNINLAASSENKKYSLVKLFSIFMAGGIASFGIMAIITHFAKSPEEQKQTFTTQHQVSIAEEHPRQADDKVIVIKPKLPPKPVTPGVESAVNLLAPIKNDVQTSGVKGIELNPVQVVKLPHLKEPEFLIKPVYKVMPKLSAKALREQKYGAIRLRYKIDGAGNVKNIEVINSEVSRGLQRSAKKALAKWKYQPADNVQRSYEIIFEFNPRK